MMNKTFEEFIKENGYTTEELAKIAGVSARILGHYVTGDRPWRNATLETAIRVAHALGIDADRLVCFDQDYCFWG